MVVEFLLLKEGGIWMCVLVSLEEWDINNYWLMIDMNNFSLNFWVCYRLKKHLHPNEAVTS